MTSTIDEELSLLFSDTPCVIDDEFKFKVMLKIGDEHFSYLNSAKNLVDFGESFLVGGVGGGFLATTIYSSSIGFGAQLLAFVGIGSTPIGWIVGASILGTAGIFGFKKAKNKFFSKVESELIIKVPKYLNTPLDLLGLSLATLMLPVSIQMANSDGNFCSIEKEKIKNYFIDIWGFNAEFIDSMIIAQESKIEDFSYKEYMELLETVCSKTSEFKLETLTEEIIDFQREIILMDGIIHPGEEMELAKLKLYV